MLDKLPPLPQPKPENQIRGWKNRAEGKAFEDRLDRSFAYYAERGFALIDKTPEPFKIIKRLEHTRFIGCFLKKAQPDYKGTVKGGRSVIFEAKHTTSDRIEQDRVSDVQADYMTKASALGARCYVLAGYKSGSVYRIPWSAWADMKRIFGHKYVTEEQLKKYQVQTSWNDLLLILE